jgi:O-antigen/teichoic acid export membrane protein
LNEIGTGSFATLFMPTAARMFAKDDRVGINHLYWRTAIWMAIGGVPRRVEKGSGVIFRLL